MSDAATLPILLKGLRLPTFTRQWKPLAELAESQGWSVTRYLAQLCELETAERQTRRARGAPRCGRVDSHILFGLRL